MAAGPCNQGNPERKGLVGQIPVSLVENIVGSMDRGNPSVVHATDASNTNAPWGELMSTVAIRNGAVGCICDSCIRDTVKIIEMGFPVYCAGIRPVDSKGCGIAKAYDVPIRCGDVLVAPGGLVFADFDGIVVIPGEVEEKVLELALEKVGKENSTRVLPQSTVGDWSSTPS